MSASSPLRASLRLAALLFATLPSLADDPVEEWRLDFNGAAASSALDSRGNLLNGALGHTMKISPTGTVLWDRDFDLPGGHTILAWLAVDSQDNVIRGGYHEGPGGGFLAVKYDADGNLLWHSIASIGTAPQGRRVAVDEFDDIYVFGEIWGGASGTGPTGHDFMTVKFDSGGAMQWARVAHGTNSDEPNALAVRDGRVAVTGHTGGPFMTVCYDYAGNELWQRFYTDGIWGGNDVAIGAAGEVVVCGWGAVNGVAVYAGTIVQYDAAGNLAWVLHHNGPHGAVDNYRRLAIDEDGSVVAVGWGAGAGAYYDWSIVKVDPTGALAWARQYDGITTMDESATAVVLGPGGSVYVGGHAGPTCVGLGTEGHVLKFAADGTPRWVHHLDCGTVPEQLHVDRTAALMVGGRTQVFRLRERVGSSYCSPAVVNSTGLPASILATGSSLAAHGELTLAATQVPPERFGYFLASQTQGLVTSPPGSQGNLCLGGTIARFAAQVQSSGPEGLLAIPVDLTSIPASPPHAVLGGETWNFQAWFRDANPSPTSNFTDGVSIPFL